MIISMRPGATRQEVEHVTERIQEFGFKVHSIAGEERVVIGVVGVGGDVTAYSYGASKAALNWFVQAFAATFGKRGIRSNALAPGSVPTPGAVAMTSTEEYQRRAATIPMGEGVKPPAGCDRPFLDIAGSHRETRRPHIWR